MDGYSSLVGQNIALWAPCFTKEMLGPMKGKYWSFKFCLHGTHRACSTSTPLATWTSGKRYTPLLDDCEQKTLVGLGWSIDLWRWWPSSHISTSMYIKSFSTLTYSHDHTNTAHRTHSARVRHNNKNDFFFVVLPPLMRTQLFYCPLHLLYSV